MHTLVVFAASGEVEQVKTVIDVRTIAMLLSVLVPLGVQLLAKQSASAGVKAFLNLAGVALVSALAFVMDPGATVITWQAVTNVFIASVVTSLGSYNVLKAFGITGTIAEKTKNIGIGSPPTLQTEDVDKEDTGAVDENTH